MPPPSRRNDRPLGNPPPDCQSCGVCCFSTLAQYLRVWGVDHERMGDGVAQHTTFIGNQCFMRIEDGHCAALVIDPDRRRFSCSIYEQRSDACRSLVAGTSACLGEMHEKGDRPAIAIAAMLRKRNG
ncbi:MAG: YkgJ family cysteine cluster protein [Deltaproteobacteria bacterium]|nr:YkgJ family cysteine cluster protein [Deltaproteobacteria bacterium]